jgi:hypothetical protein
MVVYRPEKRYKISASIVEGKSPHLKHVWVAFLESEVGAAILQCKATSLRYRLIGISALIIHQFHFDIHLQCQNLITMSAVYGDEGR